MIWQWYDNDMIVCTFVFHSSFSYGHLWWRSEAKMSRVVKAKGSGEVLFFTVICHLYLGGQIFVIFPPYLGKTPIWTNIFQGGWNHQLDIDFIIHFASPLKGRLDKNSKTHVLQQVLLIVVVFQLELWLMSRCKHDRLWCGEEKGIASFGCNWTKCHTLSHH